MPARDTDSARFMHLTRRRITYYATIDVCLQVTLSLSNSPTLQLSTPLHPSSSALLLLPLPPTSLASLPPLCLCHCRSVCSTFHVLHLPLLHISFQSLAYLLNSYPPNISHAPLSPPFPSIPLTAWQAAASTFSFSCDFPLFPFALFLVLR